MISKQYRLTEREVRKVLARKKPFFSYTWIANTSLQPLGRGRIGILLSSKCAKGSVNRNFWRRRFYDLSRQYVDKLSHDILFVPKKGTELDHKNKNQLVDFEKNVQFLYKKILESLNTPHG